MRLAYRTTRLAGCGALSGAGTYTDAPESVTIVAALILPPIPTTINVNDARVLGARPPGSWLMGC